MIKIRMIVLILFATLFSASLLFAGDHEVNKSFTFKKKVRVKLVLSDCEFVASADKNINVSVKFNYDPDEYEVSFKEKSSSITMKEEFRNSSGNHSGDSNWKIAVPKDVKIDFNSATGDIEIHKVEIRIDANTGTGEISIRDSKGEFDINTGTGDIEVSNSEGEFDLNTGTGSVDIKESSGSFSANSGTGNVKARMITIVDDADFNSGTGDVKIIHPLGSNYDLSLNSGTDDAILDLDGVPVDGYFELSANARRGDIDCPVKFDKEEEIDHGNNKSLRKSFTRGKSKNRFFIGTGNGTAKLIK